MNHAHVLIMHHHSEIRPLSIKPQSFHLSKVDVRALHLGVEPAERYHLAEHCQSADISTQPPARQGLVGLTSPAWPVGAPGSRRHAGAPHHAAPRRARVACYGTLATIFRTLIFSNFFQPLPKPKTLSPSKSLPYTLYPVP